MVEKSCNPENLAVPGTTRSHSGRFYLSETKPLSLHLGSFGSPFFLVTPGRVPFVILSVATISRSEMVAESKDPYPRQETRAREDINDRRDPSNCVHSRKARSHSAQDDSVPEVLCRRSLFLPKQLLQYSNPFVHVFLFQQKRR